jgi:hypothetical protein
VSRYLSPATRQLVLAGWHRPAHLSSRVVLESLREFCPIGDARVEPGYDYRHHRNGRYAGFLFSMTGARPDPMAGPAK